MAAPGARSCAATGPQQPARRAATRSGPSRRRGRAWRRRGCRPRRCSCCRAWEAAGAAPGSSSPGGRRAPADAQTQRPAALRMALGGCLARRRLPMWWGLCAMHAAAPHSPPRRPAARRTASRLVPCHIVRSQMAAAQRQGPPASTLRMARQLATWGATRAAAAAGAARRAPAPAPTRRAVARHPLSRRRHLTCRGRTCGCRSSCRRPLSRPCQPPAPGIRRFYGQHSWSCAESSCGCGRRPVC